MMRLFADLPEALDNTVEIARRCRTRPRDVQPILPRFVAAADPRRPSARRPTSCAGRRQQGLERRLAAHGWRRARPRRTTASGWNSSSASSRR